MTNVKRMTLGDVEIIRLTEWHGGFLAARTLAPDVPEDLWKTAGLEPDHLEPGTGMAVVALQTWVLRSAGRTVVVDPGVGNGRERPSRPMFHNWQGDFPGLLDAAGIRPEDVDTVVNTHLHADHVGWNTRDENGEWAPMFPNARYFVPAADDAHFGPANGYAGGARADDRLMYEDSVAPVHRAGQAVVWDGFHRIDEHLTLEAAPGHTPGSAVLRLASGGDRAVFVGDVVHNPVQLLAPECSSCLCEDPKRAAESRRRVLERAADERELVVPAHFAGAGAVEVRRAGGGLALGRWAAYGG
ncbi:MBL fold metallo-hydrolase [Actinomadura atramentaria]|uniref:MBL fold metallo-hydrolase n=1 Tax=Actinomadura atramentaria TaxID=1990 RepID=UPI0005277C03|nr:MBL fold metallo-hydrolase [Actinomadura atramentaria]